MRFKLGNNAYQIVGMPFGWSLSPWWATKLSKPIRSWMGQLGCTFNLWVDDILLLGRTKLEVETRAAMLINMLTQLGLKVNIKKSMHNAAQTFTYVGQQIDLQNAVIRHIPEKNQRALGMTKHQLKGNTMQPKNIAALAGTLLDLVKGNASLLGIPQQLMKLAGQMARQTANHLNLDANHYRAWCLSVAKPTDLDMSLQTYLEALQHATPMKRFGKPEEIASAILYLAADESSFITGQSIILDGGLILQ